MPRSPSADEELQELLSLVLKEYSVVFLKLVAELLGGMTRFLDPRFGHCSSPFLVEASTIDS